jgi:hypothetical protein
VTETWVLALWTLVIGSVNFWAGVYTARRPSSQPIAPTRKWVRLPSGFSHDYGPGLTGYVTPTDDGAYWWLSRNGRTLIEGPCRNVEAGKREVAKAAQEMGSWAASFRGTA